MNRIEYDKITINSCTADDIELIAEYLTNCSDDFLRSFGADKKKVPPKDVLIENFKKTLDHRGIVRNFIIASYKGRKIGHSNVNNIIENESAVIHAQVWSPELRGAGIAEATALQACEHFLNEFNLKKIIFKIPKINKPANRAVEKLGLVNLGEVIYEFSMMIEPLVCNMYEIDRETIVLLRNRSC